MKLEIYNSKFLNLNLFEKFYKNHDVDNVVFYKCNFLEQNMLLA
jgi:hypothetical protein